MHVCVPARSESIALQSEGTLVYSLTDRIYIAFTDGRNACTHFNVHVFTREHIAFRARSHRACVHVQSS